LLVVSTVLLSFWLTCSFFYLLVFVHLSLVSVFFVSVENTGVSLAPLQPDDEDPLMAAVNLLESNWISV
jgi:hypothetical protein